MENREDPELKLLRALVEALSAEGLDDAQKRRAIAYASDRCIKKEPAPRLNDLYQAHYAQTKGLG